ncbi:MAG: LPXTG cell wall anchor domain-containing protein [Lachnospiraceae bacterium]|nr:LPXTG cell wall anchor domain-containing protein [Lachnospiraceae bacterium]
MDSPILKELAKFLHEKKTHRRWMVVFVSLAVIVGLGTAFALKMMGQAMTRKEKVLVCAVQPHAHTEECQDAEGNLICGLADYIVHTHNDDCYDSDGNLACQLAEVPLHQHEDACYAEERFLVCGLEEGEIEEGGLELDPTVTPEEAEPQGHIHTEECYETQRVLACGQFELHMHSLEAGCYEEVPPAEEGGEVTYRLICGLPQLEEHIHTEEAGCFEIHEAHMLGIDLGTETAEPEQETPAEGVSPENPEAAEAAEDAVTAENPADVTAEEPAAQSASPEEPDEFVKVYNGEGYIVTAIYGKEAELPEEAELIAELITPESDKEHYAEREAEYKEQVGDEDATMSALLKVGFYINGGEIEPKAAVKISVQMLDENGLPEGMPMTVVHFAEEGNEVLKGSEVENGKTSFEMNSFSEVALGHTAGDRQIVKVNKTQVYDGNRAFRVTFHLTGEVELPEGVMIEAPEGTDNTPDAPQNKGDAGQPEDSEESGEDGIPESEGSESDIGSSESSGAQDDFNGEEVSGDAAEDGEETAGGSADMTEGEESAETEGGGSQEEASGGEENSDAESGAGDSEENFLSRQLDFRIEPVDEASEEYKAIKKQAEKTAADGSEVLSIFAVSYALVYDNQELELNGCEIEAEVTPTKEFGRKVEISMVEAVAYLLENNTAQLTADQKSITGLEVTGLELDGDGLVNQENTMYIDDEAQDQDMQISVSPKNTVRFFAVRSSGTPNPEFTVQYYAYLDKVDWKGNQTGNAPGTQITKDNVGHPEAWGAAPSGLLKGYRESISKGYMPIIDTSGKNGGDLPKNGVIPNLNSIQLDTDGSIKMIEKDLTAVYEERRFEYHKAPTINYFNALIENASYDLTEVWIDPKGDSDSTDPSDWTVYKDEKLENLHFTNRKETHDKYPDKYILIDSNTVIRLVYDTNKENRNSPATFYDYDIGEMAGAYWQINNKGINSPSNYVGTDKSKAKYAFGNNNAVDFDGTQDVANKKTGLGEEQIISEDNLTKSRLNMGNWYAGVKDGQPLGSYGYAGCTFGLVTGSAGNNVVFHNKIDAPEVFGSSKNVEGKTIYQGDSEQNYSLDFLRNGDTYTLTGVRGTNAQNLEKFKTPVEKYQYIKTNSFWPMDGVSGADGKNGPASDESGNSIKEHNNYFGMYYAVSFELDPEYIGPLEYLFFGDDDMWVFLDDSTLVCDIGGVHSSVGEYVDLWDHLHKHTSDCFNDDNDLTCTLGSHKHTDACYAKDDQGNKVLTCTRNKHTLKFFYTERGASGSSCWMQFTIPSVSSMTPETTDEDFGHLEVDKKIFITANGNDYLVKDIYHENQQQADFCNEKEFTFTIALQGLVDDYAYVKYDRDGNPINTSDGSGILAWDTISNGETFTLKDGEYISIRYLPAGTGYTITEEKDEGEGKTGVQIQGIVYDSTHITVDQNDEIKDLKAEGTIKPTQTSKVHYVNKYHAYELPKTGGTGKTPYTMAGVIGVFGAGLLYRKKFRERRVRRSS